MRGGAAGTVSGATLCHAYKDAEWLGGSGVRNVGVWRSKTLCYASLYLVPCYDPIKCRYRSYACSWKVKKSCISSECMRVVS
jgi:hypothetical protein